MKDGWGRIVAIDFGASSFLPVCFIEMALREGDRFTQLVAKHVQLPESSQLNALLTAHYALVPFNTNNLLVLFPFSCLSFPCKETDLNVLHRCPIRSQDQGQVNIAYKPSENAAIAFFFFLRF